MIAEVCSRGAKENKPALADVASRAPDVDRAPGTYRRLNLVAACILLALALSLRLASPSHDNSGALTLFGAPLPSLCLFRATTGHACPGCGTARGMVLFFRGRVTDARASHPASVWLACWLLAQIPVRFVLWRRPHPSARLRRTDLALSSISLIAAAWLPALLAPAPWCAL